MHQLPLNLIQVAQREEQLVVDALERLQNLSWLPQMGLSELVVLLETLRALLARAEKQVTTLAQALLDSLKATAVRAPSLLFRVYYLTGW